MVKANGVIDAVGIHIEQRANIQGSHLMPFVRIDLIEGKPSSFKSELSGIVYQVMASMLNVPENDRFQVISEHKAENFIFDPRYLDIERTSNLIFIQITLVEGRTVNAKVSFFKALADRLHDRLQVRRQDVFINLVENSRDNWSFGNGIAQYAAS